LPRLSDSVEHSESDMKRVLPSLTSSAIAPTLSSMGTVGSTRDVQKTSSVSIDDAFETIAWLAFAFRPETKSFTGRDRRFESAFLQARV
jgi:hypothetical protein